MLIEDTYLTIAESAEGIFKDKGSKFIAYAFPVKNELAVKTQLLALRNLHPSARHHCYAYRLDSQNYRTNDDGEPAGTAGKPIYNQLVSQNLSQILIVVVRYFGGTLLGVPGLINAYKESSKEVLSKCELVSRIAVDLYEIQFSYQNLNQVMKLLKENKLKIWQQIIDSQCTFQIEIRKSILEKMLTVLAAIPNLKYDYQSSH